MSREAARALIITTLVGAVGFLIQQHRPASAAGPGGGIDGTVKFTGTAPPNALIRMGADPNCLQANAGKRVTQDSVLVNPNGTLKNVFVHLTGPLAGAPPPPSEPVVVEQKNCVYQPRVSAARVGQKLEIVNSDNTLHNIHSHGGDTFNVGQPRAGLKYDYTLKSEGVLYLRCDVHPWMAGAVGVVSHPYFAVTGDDGAFHLASVPPGHYTLEAWHERFGALTQPVDVTASGSVKVDFSYTGTEKAPPPPSN
jgi:plastocyanin